LADESDDKVNMKVNEEKEGITVNFSIKGQESTPEMLSGEEPCPSCSRLFKEHSHEQIMACAEKAKPAGK